LVGALELVEVTFLTVQGELRRQQACTCLWNALVLLCFANKERVVRKETVHECRRPRFPIELGYFVKKTLQLS